MASAVVISTTARVGSRVILHSINARMAPISDIQSKKGNIFSPFTREKKKTIDAHVVAAPVAHEPGPPPLIICAAKAIQPRTDHRNHEKACGFVPPLRTSCTYGM